MSKLDGVYYGARKIGNDWGIWVVTVRNGSVETENLNKMPWPTREIAAERAKTSAIAEAEREGLNVIGEIWDGRVPSAA